MGYGNLLKILSLACIQREMLHIYIQPYGKAVDKPECPHEKLSQMREAYIIKERSDRLCIYDVMNSSSVLLSRLRSGERSTHSIIYKIKRRVNKRTCFYVILIFVVW